MVTRVPDSVIERGRPIVAKPTEWQHIRDHIEEPNFSPYHGYRENRSCRCLFFFVTSVTGGKGGRRSETPGYSIYSPPANRPFLLSNSNLSAYTDPISSKIQVYCLSNSLR
jgi:hypothetical protein